MPFVSAAGRRNRKSIARLAGVAAVAAIAVVMAASPAARAEDAFYFNNDTGMAFTPNDQDGIDGNCWLGATGLFIPGPTGAVNGSIRSDVGPFDQCSSMWGSNLGYDQQYIGSYTQQQTGGQVYLWYGGIGAFGFSAYDPALGSATVACASNGTGWETGNGFTPIEAYMTSEADGTTCTVDWLPGVDGASAGARAAANTSTASHTRFVDSLAEVWDGRAHPRVQTFGTRRVSVRDAVVLRTRGGKVIGRGTKTLRVGDEPQTVAVTLSRSARKVLAKGRELTVRASIEHARGAQGTGDTTAQLVVRGKR